MKRLFEIVAERNEKSRELAILRKEFETKEKALVQIIADLSRLENVAQSGLDVVQIQLAESVLSVSGDPYGQTDQRNTPLADRAISDIANNTKYMREGYFGNKTYSGYYQESSHPYGMGPSHGGIVDSVGLKKEATKRDLTDDEKDACIYYLKNYVLIKQAKTETK